MSVEITSLSVYIGKIVAFFHKTYLFLVHMCVYYGNFLLCCLAISREVQHWHSELGQAAPLSLP